MKSGALWASDDPAQWAAVLGRYEAAVKTAAARSESKAALAALDRWHREELPAQLAAAMAAAGGSEGPAITRDQLVKLVEWKMARGQWRPRLLAFAREQPDGAVEAASREALRLLRRREREGQETAAQAAAADAAGPATASALLSAADPGVPYMGDEAMAAALPPGRGSDYSLKAYLQLAEALRGKAARLRFNR
ncbi:hypothetical protein GPECTOR_47g394 [Gonium pectorale]|uniref:Uncharacterized protein n=1 Tax=Gonium pectorale TaxID=33097 RepID=A0A150G8C8_GONPE|nr:hypothetical protein GPECTOR_47g394 [Gonium pectorale]|eukprot:KXZ46116.1 hypothetical protein GPECTOR_47g394 [Gonium pectorale]